MIQLSNIRKVYQSKSGQEVVALNNISFNLPEKGMVFIIGKSGSGKSTLLNLLGGLDKPTGGDIFLGADALSSNFILDAYRNTSLGFIFQEFHLLDTLTVYENISLALEMKGEVVRESDIKTALEKVDLAGLTNRYPEELSGGQKQRVAIARALIKKPQIILADEPTGNLDSTTSQDILELLKELSSDKLVVVVSHDKEAAGRFGDRVIELKDGNIVSDITNDNEKIVSEKPQIVALKHAKFSHKSVFKFVISALGHKKARLVASVLLSVIAIVMFGMSFVISTYDTEKQITKNIKKTGMQSFIVSPIPNLNIKETSISVWDIFGDEKAVPSTMFDYMSNNYVNAGVAGLYYGDWFHVPYENGLIDGIHYSVLITSASDVENVTGLKLMPGYLELNLGSIYLTDATIRSLSTATAIIDDDNTIVSAYFYIKNGNNYDITQGTPLADLIGSELWERGTKGFNDVKVAIIAGIVETNFATLMERYEEEDSYAKAIDEYTLKYLYSLVFCNKETYMNQFKPVSSFSIDFKQNGQENDWRSPCYDIQIFKGQQEHKISGGLSVYLVEGVMPDEILSKLANNEVALSLSVYNSVFDEQIMWSSSSGFQPMPQHIGDTITIRINDKSGRTIAILQDVKVKQIVNGNTFGGNDVFVNSASFDTLYPASVNARVLMVNLGAEDDMEKFVKSLRENGYYIFAPFSLGLYDFEVKFDTFNIIFWSSAGILLLFSALLIMNFITTGVTAKKKEIGILRAIGARVTDTEKIFIFEALLIATIIAVLSLGLLIVATFAINLALAVGFMQGTTIISFNWLAIPIIVGLSYIITALSASLPAYRISKMKPADAIKKGA